MMPAGTDIAAGTTRPRAWCGPLLSVGGSTVGRTEQLSLSKGNATLVGDAHTTGDKTSWGAPPPDQVIAHTNLYWSYQTAPGRKAGTVKTSDVDFGG